MPPRGKGAELTLGSQWAISDRSLAVRADLSEIDILPKTRAPSELPAPAENDLGGQVPSTEIQDASRKPKATPLIRLRPSQVPHRRFEVLQQFEGVVLEVHKDGFEAVLSDLTDPDKAEEFVELPLSEISPADRPLLVPGCIFYWILGYERRKGGQTTRVSEVRLKRSPPWSPRAVEAIRAKARETFKFFTTDGKNTTLQD